MKNEIIDLIKATDDGCTVEVQIDDTSDENIKSFFFITDASTLKLRLYKHDADELDGLLNSAEDGADFVERLQGFLTDPSTVFPPKKDEA